MIRIRRVYSTQMPADFNRIHQVKEIFRAAFPYLPGYAEKIPPMLDNPLDYPYRTLLLVSEDARGNVTGFAIILHFPEINSSFLDFLAVAPHIQGSGLGSALYEAVRDAVHQIGSRGLYLEALSDDPEYVHDETELEQNRQRLRFYERYRVYPITNTLYDEPTAHLPAGFLLFDGLGSPKPLTRAEAIAAVRCIIQRKHRKEVGPDYINRVADSFRDDPVGFRAPRYTKSRSPRYVKPSRLESPFALTVVPEEHAVHLVRQQGYVERPARIEAVLEGIKPLGIFTEFSPQRSSEKPIRAVHEADFVNYLKATCQKLKPDRPVYPYIFPVRRPERPPKDLSVRAGYYCVDTFTPLDHNAYRAARGAVDVVLTAAGETLSGRPVSYALCRPPGHHAGKRTFGGFCYFNNAAIAAHRLSEMGKVAVLDIDYHHGNGTQDIFYDRDDVLTISLHGHPRIAYPHFSGFADETGEGRGLGFNRNFPLPSGADGQAYLSAFEKAIDRIERFRPTILVISLGLDMLKGDPTGSFQVPIGTMRQIGNRLGAMRLPLLIVQEGGYSLHNLRRGTPALFMGIAEAISMTQG
jgi:acetoin utilization deacetylase AcuC-like enzyme/GNAT superfamily N-acetyltransferase